MRDKDDGHSTDKHTRTQTNIHRSTYCFLENTVEYEYFFPQRNCDFIGRKLELDTTLIQSNCHRLSIYDYNIEEQIHCRICRIVVGFAQL
jgi:hypothetical protein